MYKSMQLALTEWLTLYFDLDFMCWKFRKKISLQRIINLVLGLCLKHLEFFKLLLTSNTSHTVAIQNDHFLTDNYQYYITL